ncbi:MgtC/SapB family protein [Brevundimonas sp. VNH65]|uniref:MgtC/SapB family protein n=1 Tax=Brevundimonas sp. VNH65 TaxID=3400917 RepID=UPI003C071AEB
METELLEAVGLPILGSIVAGGVIGLEREWRGRAAGFRTHILVCLASTLLMLAAMSQADWAFEALPDENIVTDPTRMAHGVLTGIGFLCAGVIFRTGFSIHGLTTAASLWITSAIGILFGAGLYGVGALGTAVTALILIGLRLVSRRLPALQVVDVEVAWRRDASEAERGVEALLNGDDVRGSLSQAFEMTDDVVRRTWRLKARSDLELKALSHGLAARTDVVAYRLTPRER